MCEKIASKKTVQNECFRAMFRTIFGAPFLGVDFPAVRSAFLGPYNARKVPLSDLLPKPPFFVFGCILPAVPRVLRRKFPLSLRFREFSRGRTRKCRYTWPGLTSSGTNPLETAEINVFWLGGWFPYDLPKFCRKNGR